jgi:hypothetical protein
MLTGLGKMALRKLAWMALKEKHNILQLGIAIGPKVAPLLGLIVSLELVFLSQERQFLVIFPKP